MNVYLGKLIFLNIFIYVCLQDNKLQNNVDKLSHFKILDKYF